MIKVGIDKLQEAKRRLHNAGGLVIAPNIFVAEHMAQLLETITGNKPILVHSELVNSENKIASFRNSKKDWIVSVAMISEGVDIKRLRVLLYLPNSQTELSFRQAMGRIVRTMGPDDDSISHVVLPTYKILENYYGKKDFNDGRKKMAKLPATSQLIYNPSSAAPGFKIRNVLCLPGVPSILKSMIENTKRLLQKGSKTYSETINVLSVESNIARTLSITQNKFKKDVSIGSYPFFRLGRVGVSIVFRSSNKKRLKKCLIIIKKILKERKIRIFKISRK